MGLDSKFYIRKFSFSGRKVSTTLLLIMFYRLSLTLRRFLNSPVAPYFLVGLLMVLRNYNIFDQPGFFEEEAEDFFIGALNLGWRSLFEPMCGYYFFLERTLAWIISWFPIQLTSLLYVLSALAFNILVAGYFSREGFSWLILDRGQRIFVCLLLAVAPGTPEVFLNIVNLSTVMCLFGFLLLIEKPFRMSWLKLATFAVLLFSSGQLFLLAPVVLYLWYISKDKRYLYLLLLFPMAVILNFMATREFAGSTGLLNYLYLLKVPQITVENIVTRFFVAPLFGSFLTGIFMKSAAWFYWSVVALSISFALYICLRTRKVVQGRLTILILGYFCLSMTFGVAAVARSYSHEQLLRNYGDIVWTGRYSFLPGAIAIILWSSILFWLLKNGSRKRQISVLFLIFVLTFHILSHWGTIGFRKDPGWVTHAALLQSVLDLQRAGQLQKPVALAGPLVHPDSPHYHQVTLWITPSGEITSSEIANNLGLRLAQQGLLDEAMKQYYKALEIKPDHAEAHNNLAVALTQQGRISEGIGHAMQALQINPQYSEAHLNWGNALFGQGLNSEAEVHYREALQLNPNLAEGHNNLGVILAQTGKIKEAIEEFKKALAIDSDQFDAQKNLKSLTSE